MINGMRFMNITVLKKENAVYLLLDLVIYLLNLIIIKKIKRITATKKIQIWHILRQNIGKKKILKKEKNK